VRYDTQKDLAERSAVDCTIPMACLSGCKIYQQWILITSGRQSMSLLQCDASQLFCVQHICCLRRLVRSGPHQHYQPEQNSYLIVCNTGRTFQQCTRPVCAPPNSGSRRYPVITALDHARATSAPKVQQLCDCAPENRALPSGVYKL